MVNINFMPALKNNNFFVHFSVQQYMDTLVQLWQSESE